MSIGVIIIGVIVVLAGIVLGVLYGKLVIKNYPQRDKKVGSVKAVIVFFLISVILYGILVGRSIGISVVNDFTKMMAQKINDNPQAGFLKNGVDLKDIVTDPSRAGVAVGAIKPLLPKASDLGVPSLIYNPAVGLVTDQMQSSLTDPKKSEEFVASFTEDNILTVSSLTGGVRQAGIGVINTITLVLVGIFVILLGIYLLVTLSYAAKNVRITTARAKDKAQEENAQG
jgi:hypothetical protein